jgi:arginyl-tRNA synthetase
LTPVRDQIERLVRDALGACRAAGTLPPEPAGAPPLSVTVEVPRQRANGDFATNAAMVLAGQLKQAAAPGARPPAPRAVADLLAREIPSGGLVSRVEVAGPGFLNFFVADTAWREVFRRAVAEGPRFGASTLGRGRRVQVEFVSANPTGPLHVGAARNAALGDALARLLAFAGFDVAREYYINDFGNQMELLGRSVYVRYAERFGRALPMPEEGYQGDYIRDIAADIAAADGDRHLARPEAEAVADFTDRAMARVLESIRVDLEAFGVRFERWFSERTLYAPPGAGAVDRAVAALRAAGHLYEQDGALWFRSTAFGDDKDRVVLRADGRPTYFASDIAYTKDKYDRGFERLLNVLGADHHGYVPRLKAVAQALGRPADSYRVPIIQLVKLVRGGVEVKMSKRAGEYTTMRELIDEVGRDAARFFLLMRRADAPLDFDLELAKSQSTENPVYYVQYAHARISSVLRQAAERGVPVPASADQIDLSRLVLEDELELARLLAAFPDLVETSARNEEPHHVTFYLQDLAARFHGYYNRTRVITDDPADTAARLVLVQAVRAVLANALGLLGVSAPDRMTREPEEARPGSAA